MVLEGFWILQGLVRSAVYVCMNCVWIGMMQERLISRDSLQVNKLADLQVAAPCLRIKVRYNITDSEELRVLNSSDCENLNILEGIGVE